MTTNRLIGLYIGHVTAGFARGRASAINKQPVAGPVAAGPLGLAGDEQADPENHGGPERALLHYSLDRYPGWRAQYPEHAARFAPAGFGENLASHGMDEHNVHIGDIYRVGTARVQVSQPRTPCWKLDARFDLAGLAREVQTSGRCGWFYRVLEPGHLAAGDPIEHLERPPDSPSIADAMAAIYRQPHRGHLQRLADCATLAENWREKARRRLRGAPDAGGEQRLTGAPPT
ncbi:MOSC domain-containing protein [Thioalkalivibrio sp. ALJ16]|uniref:MOSC domain-containing protein n=1 Tax=Thioalkalivibrio sp. ALJ16 TaxID=1158762 RepID=UPI000367B15F|nr:MOSC domain-containing protein [Thioalkalivibrio sp. ALJ16]